jgi:NADPH2:quinone reductase
LRGRDSSQKQAIRDALGREVWPLLGTKIRPVIERTFPIAETGQAHDFMVKTGHTGKILLQLA